MKVRGKHEFDKIPTVNSGDNLVGVEVTTADPVVGNDNTQGYYQGYLWIATTSGTTFVCEDASTGAAIWTEINGSGFPFSGSAIITGSLLVSGSNVDFTNATGVSGSFSGSFIGDGSGLIGVTAEWDGTHVGNAEITGSLYVSESLTANGLVYPGTANANKGWHLETDGAGNIVIDRARIYADVKNVTAGTLFKGTPVHVSSSVGNIDEVIAASASNAATMPATFVLAEDLAPGAEGLGILTGFINGVDTSGFGEGDVVYVDYNGGYTNIKPTGSAQIQNLGIVTSVAVNGSGFVYGSGRATDTPNLLTGNVFYGVADAATQLPLADIITGSFFNYTGSLQGTASYALLAETASYTITNFVTQSLLADTASFITGSNVFGPYGSNSIISSSYAVTASYALSSPGGGGSQKWSRSIYMYNVITSGGTGFNWNGITNIGAPAAAITSNTHPHRIFNFAGNNNAQEGIYFETHVPNTYTNGSNIRVTINSAGDTLTGGAVFYCGLTQPTAANVLGGSTETEWIAQTATFTGVTGYNVVSLTYTFTGTNITAGDSLLFRIYRDPNDASDTLNTDVALVTLQIEEV
jgi:hypothetical protein